MLTKSDLSNIRSVIKDELSNHPTKAGLTSELKPLKADLAQIRKDVKAIVSFFDREYVELRRRVEQIEHHLGISTS